MVLKKPIIWSSAFCDDPRISFSQLVIAAQKTESKHEDKGIKAATTNYTTKGCCSAALRESIHFW